MKRAKLWSVLLAALILCACALGILFTGALAEENLVLYAVGDLQVAGATQVESIQDALADLEKNSRNWSADTTAEIRIKGDGHSGGSQNGVIFGQVTIWREDGSKLPIKILGVDSGLARDSYIYLDSAGGWYACANDYTFENLTLPVGDQETFFFAGSGNVTMKDVNFVSSGDLTVETVADRTAMYQNARAAAVSVCTDADGLITPDVNRLPCGDAWQQVRTSAAYHATGEVKTDKNGDAYVDKDLTGKSGTAYGDYGHAGDTGGGQYLNACVYYEAILGLDCRDNDWTPTKYALDEDLRKLLQQAAHDAVVAVYGEEHFTNPPDYDVDDNNVVNVLMMGSSSSYYMRDELHFMANHVGIKLRVVHAYSSGIKMNTQWSWANNGTGKWSVYTEWNGETKGPEESQKLSDYVNDYPWDAIVTYETGGSFNKKKLGVTGFSEESVAEAIAVCGKADEFINYVYNYNETNANARYFWFQTVGAPVGAPGPNDDALGYLYGDNCTSAVYAGWTQADLERYTENGKLAASSVTLCKGADYGSLISAVGYIDTVPEATYTDETAKQVEFLACSGYDSYEIPVVLPVNTVGKIVVDGATIGKPQMHKGFSPASALLQVKKGYSGSVTLCNRDKNPRYGDVLIKLTGGTIDQIDTLYYSQLIGDLTFFMDDIDGEVALVGMLRLGFTDNSVSGDITADVRAGTIGASVYPGGSAGGTVYNSFSDCEIAANYFGIRSGTTDRVINNIKNVKVVGDFYGGHYSTSALKLVENHIDGLTVGGVFCGGSYSSETNPKITGDKITIDGKEETLAIYNDIKDLTVTGDFYGASNGGTIGAVRNDIQNITVTGYFYGGAQGADAKVAKVINNVSGGHFLARFYASGLGSMEGEVINKISGDTVFEGNFYGSTSDITVGNVTTEVSGNPTFISTFNAMGYDASVEESEGKTLTTTISGGTFKGNTYLSGQILRNRVATITVYDGDFDYVVYFGAYNSKAKEINTTVKGGTFANTVFGGNKDSSDSVSVEKITTTIEGGVFDGDFYGGNRGCVNGTVHTVIRGGTFKANFYGGSYGKDNPELTAITSIINEVYGGTFNNFYGGSRYGTVGTITNTVNGAVTKADSEGEGGTFNGGCSGTTGFITNTIENVTTEDNLYLGNSSGTCNGITSVIKNAKVQGSFACGNDGGTLQGKVKTTIYDCDVKTYTYAAGNSKIVTPEGFAEEYLVECEILGGTFKGFWGGGASASTTMTANVKVVVRGGTFNNYSTTATRQNALSAGGRNKKLVGNSDVFIYGGTFNGEVIAGACPNSSGDSYIHDDEGTQTVTIYGGTFNKPILAGSKWGTVTKGKVVLNPTESDIIINSTMLKRDEQPGTQEFEIVGADHKIILGVDAEIEATSASGDVKIGQSGTWKKQVYVSLPEDNTANVTVSGPHCLDKIGESVVAVKGGVQLAGATMILTDRVAVRALFDKASVDQIDDFAFTFKMGEETLASGSKADLEAFGEDYYGIVLAKIGAKDFTSAVTFTGSDMVWDYEFSVELLADMAEEIWTDEAQALAKAMHNFATIVADPTAELPNKELAPDLSKVEGFTASASRDDGTNFVVNGKGLVMSNAVGIRIYGTASAPIAGTLTITVNGTDVTQKAVIAAGEGENAYTIDLYVNAKNMSDELHIVITEGSKTCLDLYDRVDAIAAQYPDADANYKLAQQLLIYIQAAVAYATKA